MQLNGGVYKGVSRINPALLQEMHMPQVIVPGPPEVKEAMIYAYGFGWGIASYRGHYLVSHDGLSDGFTSMIGLLPHQGIGVIVLSNRNMSVFPRFLSLQLMDRILELPFIDWFKEGLAMSQKNQTGLTSDPSKEDFLRKKGTSPSHLLEDFVGVFEHPGYGTVSVELMDGKLCFIFNGTTSTLEHWHYDVFVIVEESQSALFSRKGSKIAFQSNVGGNIDALAIPFEPSVSDIVFKRKKEEAHELYLRKFVGIYEIYGYTVEMTLRNHALCAIIPGQPVYELVLGAENEFTVKAVNGFHIRFILDLEGKVSEAFLVMPYGTFTAKPKKVLLS
jgi:hypothetical protein